MEYLEKFKTKCGKMARNLKGMVSRRLRVMKAWPLKKKLAVSGGAVAALAVVIVGGVSLYGYFHTEEPEEMIAREVVEEEPEEVASEPEEISYQSVAISGDSVEKDLTVYFTDDSATKISGAAFQVKLANPEEAENAGLSDLAQAVYDVDAKIAELEETLTEEESSEDSDVGDSDDDTLSEDSESDTSSEDSEETDPMQTLLQEKQSAIEAYAAALEEVSGEVYTDEDMDGMIYEDGLESGDYTLCYIPTEDYAASDFLTDVNVKDQVEYEVIENIEQKVVADAGDTKPAEAAVVEATIENTQTYVESSTEETTTTEVNTSGTNISVSTSRIYSNADTAISSVLVPYSNGFSQSDVASVTTDNASVTAVAEAGGIRVTAAAGISATTNVIITVTPVSTTGSTGEDSSTDTSASGLAAYTFSMEVIGASTAVTNESGEALYTDAACTTALTVGTYVVGGTYYTKEVATTYYGWQTVDGNTYYYDSNGNYVTGSQVIDGVKYTFGSDGVLLTGGTGIDVSKWQGTIDWSKASTAVSFAIIRAGYRGSSGGLAVDSKYYYNMKNAKANGVKVGVYFYSRATTEAEAVEEASLAVKLVKEAGGCSLPIYMDVESSNQSSLSKAQLTAVINAFCSTVKSAGYSAGVYASYSWLTSKINTGSLSGISIWCARYNTYCGLPYSYDIWQYSEKGSIPGISGYVDLNEGYF